MNDDLLKALGRHQREDLEAPPAVDDPVVDDPWAALAEPFTDDEREDLLDAVFEQVDGASAGASEAEPGPVAPVIELRRGPADTASAEGEARHPAPEGKPRRALVIAMLLSAAAAATFGVWWLGRTTTPATRTTVAMLPDYATSSLHGGQASQRSEPREPVAELSMRASESIDWVVTPAEPVREPIAVALLVEPTSGPAKLVQLSDEQIFESGVVRVRGPLDRFVALAPGSWTLTLIIAPADRLPRDLASLAREDGSAWQRVAIRVNIASE